MAGLGRVLSSCQTSCTNASRAVVSSGQAAIAAAPSAAIGKGAAERLARVSKGAMGGVQAAAAVPAAATSERVSASLGMAAVVGGNTAPNTGDAAPQRRRHSSRHSGGRRSSRHGSSVGGSSAAPSRRSGSRRNSGEQSDCASDAPSRRSGSRRNSGEQSDYASDASGTSSHGGRSRRPSSAHGPMDPKEKEQRRARRAMRKYTSAFRFENGREPTTDEDWHPMRRTRALVKEGGANFPSARSSTPQKQRAGWGAALAGAGANGGEREGRPSSEVMTVAAPLKAALAVMRISGAKEIVAQGAEEPPVQVTPPPPPGLRGRMRVFLTTPKAELYILASVVMYGMFVFFDLGVGLLAADWWQITWSKIIDSAFLLLFVIELAAKLFAFGCKYLTSSPLNMVDAFAIILCAALFVLDDLANALGLMGATDDESPAIQSQGVEGLDDAAELTAEEKKANDEKMAGILLLLRLIRVVRLGAVMVRTMNMSTKMNLSRGQKATNLSGLPEAIDSKQSGWRGTIISRQWEKIRRAEATRPDVDVTKIADETKDFLQDAQNQDVVKLLTGNFNTLINVFQKLDRTRDGSLDRDEFIPGMIGLGLTPEVAEKFFTAIDVDGTGGVEVAELFRAGAFLRGGGAKKGPTEPTSPFRNGSQPAVSTSAVKLTNGGSSAPGANGVVAVGVAPVPAKKPPSSADLQLKLEALKTKLKNRAQWWTQERWDPTYEMRSTLRFLKPNKMADAKVRIRIP